MVFVSVGGRGVTFEQLLKEDERFRSGVVELLVPEYGREISNPAFMSLLATVLTGLYYTYDSRVKDAEQRKRHGGRTYLEMLRELNAR